MKSSITSLYISLPNWFSQHWRRSTQTGAVTIPTVSATPDQQRPRWTHLQSVPQRPRLPHPRLTCPVVVLPVVVLTTVGLAPSVVVLNTENKKIPSEASFRKMLLGDTETVEYFCLADAVVQRDLQPFCTHSYTDSGSAAVRGRRLSGTPPPHSSRRSRDPTSDLQVTRDPLCLLSQLPSILRLQKETGV